MTNAGTRELKVPIYVYATILSSLSIILGLIWDICWHISIGRDGLFSAPHLLIYAGAIIAGVFSGYEVLRKSFWGSIAEKAASVKIWGIFYSSLGALFCIWGAFMMLTSAPFDDWWHNTYGLDVTILSPPHTVLALGIISVQFGAMICVVAFKNQLISAAAPENRKRISSLLFILFAIASGILLTMWFTLLSEQLGRMQSHGSEFYIYGGTAFPFLLLCMGRAFDQKWTITAVTSVYTIIMLVTLWVIPLFPAEPKLGPIYNHIDHYQGFIFPLLIVIPAIALDYLRFRYKHLNDWKLSIILATAYLSIFFLVQWNMGSFLMESPYARNWFFGSTSWYFGNDPDWEFRYKFAPWMLESTPELIKGLLIAWVLCILSTRLGLKWGNWMKKIQR